MSLLSRLRSRLRAIELIVWPPPPFELTDPTATSAPTLEPPSRPLRTRCTLCCRYADSLLLGPSLPDQTRQSLPSCNEHGDRVRDLLFEAANEVWPNTVTRICRPPIH